MRFAPHPVTLRQLQYVVAVADQQSFRRAAEHCRVAQPSLSAQVAQAEHALGVRLFDRDKRRVEPTAAGRVVVTRARALLESADALVETARTLGDPFAGTLHLGVIPTIAPYLLPEIVPPLRAKHPKLAIAWAEEKTAVLAERLAAGVLDGAILALEADIGELPHAVIGHDPFVLAAAPGHPLVASAAPIAAAKLEGERVLLLDDGHCLRGQALSLCARVGAEEAGFRATSLATLVQMAATGDAFTLLPKMAVEVENRTRALRLRAFSGKGPGRTIALVWRKGNALESTLRAIAEICRTAYRARFGS